jgi:hypothetical protein
MHLPAIEGIIERRPLVNYRVAPDALAGILPGPFRPRLVNGHAIAGICLIRLAHLPGTAAFDCALLMRGVAHSWHSLPVLKYSARDAA